MYERRKEKLNQSLKLVWMQLYGPLNKVFTLLSYKCFELVLVVFTDLSMLEYFYMNDITNGVFMQGWHLHE